MTAPQNLQADPQLRDLLLTYFIETSTAAGLADWLREIDADWRGSPAEKAQRVREHTKYLAMPAADFPEQTMHYLAPCSSEDLADLCEVLGLSPEGTKDARYRRIMRAVHLREGWLPLVTAPLDAAALSAATVAPFLAWMPLAGGAYEKDFYPAIHDELSEVFGDIVFHELPVSGHSTLRIDFHVGGLDGHGGVGIEVKMPTNSADVQRAKGQLDDYQQRYRENLIVLVLGERLRPELLSALIEGLKRRGIATVVR